MSTTGQTVYRCDRCGEELTLPAGSGPSAWESLFRWVPAEERPDYRHRDRP